MEAETVNTLTQFGVAGMVCWMWLMERRSSAERDRQISESHRAVIELGSKRDGLLEVVRDNTRALVAIESGQRELIGMIGHLGSKNDRRAS